MLYTLGIVYILYKQGIIFPTWFWVWTWVILVFHTAWFLVRVGIKVMEDL